MSDIITIESNDQPKDSREDINANFEALNEDKCEADQSMTLAGSDTTEHTTTSTSEVTLATISSLNIPVGTPFRITLNVRKTSGAAEGGYIGLKLNSTKVLDSSSVRVTSTQNRAENGLMIIDVGARAANYLKPASITGNTAVDGASNVWTILGGFDADAPNATITSILILGKSGDAAITLGIKNIFIHTLSVTI
jgi:hypothetical protein